MKKNLVICFLSFLFILPVQVYSSELFHINSRGEWESGTYPDFRRFDPNHLSFMSRTDYVPAAYVEFQGDGVTVEFRLPFRYDRGAIFVGLINDATGIITRWDSSNFSFGYTTLKAKIAPARGYTLRVVDSIEGDLRGRIRINLFGFNGYDPKEAAKIISLIEEKLHVYKVPKEIIFNSNPTTVLSFTYYISLCNNEITGGRSFGEYYSLSFSKRTVMLKTIADYQKVKTEFDTLRYSPETQAFCESLK